MHVVKDDDRIIITWVITTSLASLSCRSSGAGREHSSMLVAVP